MTNAYKAARGLETDVAPDFEVPQCNKACDPDNPFVAQPYDGEMVADANATVWGMADAFLLGTGQPFRFGESDAFTQVFKEGATARNAIIEIQRQLARGKREGGGLSAVRTEWIFRDAATVTSAAFGDMLTTGNLPEAFVGSFEFTYEAEDVVGNTASIRITATNYTTIESGTRIPRADGWFFEPAYGLAVRANAWAGSFETITQEITWVEQIRF